MINIYFLSVTTSQLSFVKEWAASKCTARTKSLGMFLGMSNLFGALDGLVVRSNSLLFHFPCLEVFL